MHCVFGRPTAGTHESTSPQVLASCKLPKHQGSREIATGGRRRSHLPDGMGAHGQSFLTSSLARDQDPSIRPLGLLVADLKHLREALRLLLSSPRSHVSSLRTTLQLQLLESLLLL